MKKHNTILSDKQMRRWEKVSLETPPPAQRVSRPYWPKDAEIICYHYLTTTLSHEQEGKKQKDGEDRDNKGDANQSDQSIGYQNTASHKTLTAKRLTNTSGHWQPNSSTEGPPAVPATQSRYRRHEMFPDHARFECWNALLGDTW